MSYLGLFHLAPHLTTFDSKLQSRMSYPGTLFIEATANPFYQEIGIVLVGRCDYFDQRDHRAQRDVGYRRVLCPHRLFGLSVSSVIYLSLLFPL